MEKKMSVTLASGNITDVYFADSLKDVSLWTASYGENVFWVLDSNSARLLESIPKKSIVLEPGEVHKNIESLEKIISEALSCGSARDTRFIAFGGGVICDMTALASSLYMRGAGLTLIPTTLLCMVDATLGGKTAIDYKGGKNFVGTFYPAGEVIISADTLSTLPIREYKCGLGEVIKHAFLSSDDGLMNFLSENREKILMQDDQVLHDMVYRSLLVKKEFIEADPLETRGIRSFLNLGHTFAHALESMEGYRISHGEAVAWGLGRALEASWRKGLIGSGLKDLGIRLLNDYGYDTGYRIRWDSIPSFMSALSKDKKKSNGSIKFVLLKGIGEPLLMALDDDSVKEIVLA